MEKKSDDENARTMSDKIENFLSHIHRSWRIFFFSKLYGKFLVRFDIHRAIFLLSIVGYYLAVNIKQKQSERH